jgi:peptide/nickel transport system substrate-binding protein
MIQTPRRAALRLTILLVVAAAVLVLAAAALASEPSPSASADKVVLKIGWTVEPDTLNPFIGWQNQDYEIWSINYSFLFGFGVSDKPTLDLAAEYPTKENGGLSADGKVWTIKIRPDLKWSDGEPLTADDVAFTYNYIVKNDMYAFSIGTTGIEEARVVDPLTVEIVCAEPKADLLRIWIPILPEHIWAGVPPGKAGRDYVNQTPIVGTGPFRCVEFKKGGYVRMAANPDYYRGAPHIDEIVFQTYQNPDTMTADLEAGTIDAAQGVPQAQFDKLSRTEGLEAVAYNYRNWDYLCMNCYEGAGSLGARVLRDERFRRALNWAIDREKLAAVAWGGRAAPGTTILPPGQWVDPDYHWEPPADQAYAYDPEEAGRRLDAAGYTDTDGDGRREDAGRPITLRLWADTDSVEHQSEARLIAGQLDDVGITTRLEIGDMGVYEAMVWNYDGDDYAPDYDLFVSGWDGYFDPGQTLSTFTAAQVEGWNEAGWVSEEYDRLCAAQAVTLDTTERQRQIWRMQEIMYEQTPEIVLTYPQYLQAYDTAQWTGWTRVLGGEGPAFFVSMPDSYLNLRPVGQAAVAGGGFALWLVAAVGVAAAAVAVAAAVLGRRRRRAEEA